MNTFEPNIIHQVPSFAFTGPPVMELPSSKRHEAQKIELDWNF